MKKPSHICITVLFSLFVIFSLCSCGAKSISSDTIPLTDSDEIVRGVNELETAYCITEYGMLYPSNHTIRYYDFSTDSVYILCDKANCRHDSDTCGAWYEDPTLLNGLALYQNHCYMFRNNYMNNTWDFIRMDLTGNNIETITSLDSGSQDGDGGWLLAGINEAYYSGDMVWYVADYTYADKDGHIAGCRQYGGISLIDGSNIILNELTLDDIQFELKAITEKYIVLMKRSSDLELLSKTEFEQELKNGTFGDLFDDSDDPYYDYYRKWRPYNCNMTDSLLCYSIETGDSEISEELPTSFHTDNEGAVWQFDIQYLFLGEYNGKLLYNKLDWENDENPLDTCHLFLWDIEENIKTEVMTFSGGPALYGVGQYSPCIYDGSKFLYVTYENLKDPISYYEFDLDTMESSDKITEMTSGGDFHILGDTSDMFIARKSVSGFETFGYEIYKISKEDFFAGKLDKAVKLRL